MTEGKFFAAAAEAKVSAIDVLDVALAAAAALTGHGDEGRTYDLTGPDALTHTEMAEQLSEAIGRLVLRRCSIRGHAWRTTERGTADWQAEGLIEDYAHYRQGEASLISSGIKDASGEPPRSFNVFARDYARAFV